MTHSLSRKYGVARLGRCTPFLLSLFLSAIVLLCSHQIFLAQSDNPQEPTNALPYSLYLPLIQAKAASNQAAPIEQDAPVEWDPRLTERGARLIKAQVAPGVGYWRLTKALWYDEAESQGRHHIFIDLRDQAEQRITDIPILVQWANGETWLKTEPKAGEPYAANFDMHDVAPSYSAHPASEAPADRVEGMGMGSIEAPFHKIHTSYGLIWQWTVAASTPIPTATATITGTLTPTVTVEEGILPVPSVMVTPSPTLTLPLSTTPTVTPTLTPSPTASATPTPLPSATATATPAPTATPTPTPTTSSLAQAVVVGCQPNDRGSRFEGYVYVNGQPADGYRIVFSYEADGPWVTQPALSGSGKPGFYTHIISVGVPRVGNWYAWLVDQNRQRLSTIAAFTTDGANGACNVVSVNFLIQR
ncbi:MAG: hypothetical protein DYG89_49235 [Caldilinea sp. CFX5]|nr:hypothetical protein [Caldilinea sp. CFX5]